jgi:hypothetical protein
MNRASCLALGILLVNREVGGFCPGTGHLHPNSRSVSHATKECASADIRWRRIRRSRLFQQSNSGEDQSTDNNSEILDPREELAPPVFSLTRKSLLFDDGTSSDDEAGNDQLVTSDLGKEAGTLTLALWSGAKSVLPPLVTGASEETSGDKDAFGSLYNLMFVRLPTFFIGISYILNLVQGHPLLMDPFGTGAFEVSPIIVLAALWAILRY